MPRNLIFQTKAGLWLE